MDFKINGMLFILLVCLFEKIMLASSKNQTIEKRLIAIPKVTIIKTLSPISFIKTGALRTSVNSDSKLVFNINLIVFGVKNTLARFIAINAGNIPLENR
jgi:hypothetical protein